MSKKPENPRGILMLLHPQTGDVATFRKGEGALAVDAYRDGYRALTERSNSKLKLADALLSEREKG